MEGRDRVRDRWLRFVRGQIVPGARPLSFSITVHLVALALLTWFIVFQRGAPVMVKTGGLQQAQQVAVARVTVQAPPRRAALQVQQKQTRRVPKKPMNYGSPSNTDGPELQALKQRARQETAGLMQSFKFYTVYGFSPTKFQLAVQTSGQLPVISTAELPPHYEQYVVVEITVDSEGHVADARITTGEVERKIADKLLAAIRDFKYQPATREGTPVPTQFDLVVHIPT